MISYMPPATVANSLDSCELPEERTQGESGANELEQTVEQTPSNNGKSCTHANIVSHFH